MSDMTLTDMNPFFERHERRSRRVLVALVCTSLAVAAGIFAYGMLTIGAPGTLLARLWGSILFYPVFGIVVWACTALVRRRGVAPNVRPPMSADDARNAARVANAGFMYVLCAGVIMIATQAAVALGYFGVLPPLIKSGVLITRTSVVATALIMMYFGNAWSRRPIARTPPQRAAALMKFNRRIAWLIVLYGLLLALAALVLPIRTVGLVLLILTVAFVLYLIVSVLMLQRRLKSQSAS